MTAQHATRPSHAHAATVACRAAHLARLAGANVAQCAQVYAATYAADMNR